MTLSELQRRSAVIQAEASEKCNQLRKVAWQCGARIVSYACAATGQCLQKLGVGQWLARQFFYPLTQPGKQAQLKKEISFCQAFEKGGSTPPLDNQKINRFFHQAICKFQLPINNRRSIAVTFKMYETRHPSFRSNKNISCFNFVFIGGNHCTRESSIAPLYPYLESFLNRRQGQEVGRFFFLTGYDNAVGKNVYIPTDLNEGGYILHKTLNFIYAQYGSIDFVMGHSLGGILLGESLNHYKKNDLELPQRILFTQSPRWMWGACYNIIGCLGLFTLYPFAYLTGWTSNLAQNIRHFHARCSQQIMDTTYPSLFIVDVLQDYLCEHAWLATAPEINSLDMYDMMFDLPQQVLHERAHHGAWAKALQGAYLTKAHGTLLTLFKDNESLADLVVKISLNKMTIGRNENKTRTPRLLKGENNESS